MSRSAEDILAAAQPATIQVVVCLRGDLQARYRAVEEQLRAMPPEPDTLAGPSERVAALTAELDQIRAEIIEYREPFVFRALGPVFTEYQVRIPDAALAKQDRVAYERAYNAWICEVAAACVVEPEGFTAEQFGLLHERLSTGDWLTIRSAIIEVNGGSQDIPFSVAGSVLTQLYEEMSKRHEQSASPSPGSEAGNLGSPSPTSTGQTDG